MERAYIATAKIKDTGVDHTRYLDICRQEELKGISNPYVCKQKACAGFLLRYLYEKYKNGEPYDDNEHVSMEAALSYIRAHAAGSFVVEKTAEGMPYIPGEGKLHISISHTEGYVMAGLAEKRIGVDIQAHRQMRADIAGRFFPEKEAQYLTGQNDGEHRIREFFRLWCLHEAYVKYTGEGFKQGFKDKIFLDTECFGDMAVKCFDLGRDLSAAALIEK